MVVCRGKNIYVDIYEINCKQVNLVSFLKDKEKVTSKLYVVPGSFNTGINKLAACEDSMKSSSE